VLAAIRTLNRLELVGETLRAALNSLATVAPQWLRAWVPPAWFDRYGTRVEESRLPKGVAAPSQRKPTVACWAQSRGSGSSERRGLFHPHRRLQDAVLCAMLTPEIGPRFIAQKTPVRRRTLRPLRHGRHDFAQYLGTSHRFRPSCWRSSPRMTGEGLP
jgi:hypothetical protein